jgi:3-phosphoshikimate 1-carboxyvinyltransferase
MSVEWLDGDVHLHPVDRLDATIRLPGSKSLTNRYLVCAALADGPSTLLHASPSDDTDRMVEGLDSLGVAIARDNAHDALRLHGVGGSLPASEALLNVHHAGTAMRFLTALCTLGYGRFRIDGSPRMRQRPIRELVDALRRLGARIEYLEDEGFPPLEIEATGLEGGEVHFGPLVSSQFLSAVLMVAPYARQDVLLALDEGAPSRPYIEMTIDVMRRAGVDVVANATGDRYIVPAGARYRPGQYAIEPDASGAAYFWAAAAVTGGRVRIEGLSRSSPQGDVAFVDVLEQMGCEVRSGPDFIEVQGPQDQVLRAVNVDLNAMPDTAQTLAVLALFARGRTEIRNVANLRMKETDRLSALTAELSRLGAKIDIHRDGLTIFPPDEFAPAEIETYDDHRMAMSFAIAGLATPGIVIKDADVVSKSLPGFFELLDEAIRGGERAGE